jgi:Tol biopolymer transport system component
MSSARERTGATGDRFGAWVGARFPDGRVERISPPGGFYYQACVHPDGTAALFSGAVSGPPRLWTIPLEPLGDAVALTPPDSGARHGVWSWDGDRIAFTSDRAAPGRPQNVEEMSAQGQPELGHIFAMAPDGGNVEQLTDGVSVDQRPTFSPDGSTVVFVSDREDRIGLWRVPADGTGQAEPLPYRGLGYRPWFSVDGATLYFFTVDGDRHRLARVGLDESTAVLFDNDDQGWTHGPFVDPNGEVLIVHSTRIDGRYRLFEVPIDGSPMRALEIEGVAHPMHGTRSRNGVIAFDAAS